LTTRLKAHHFPYTTLFRSDYAEQFVSRYSGRLPRGKYLEHSSIIRRYILTVLLNSVSVRLGRPALETLDNLLQSKTAQSVFDAGDRKSTRLNSSHVSTAYA